MVRVKRGKIKSKKRKKILKLTKGFRQPYSTKKKFAKEAILHSFKYSYIGRKQKKRFFRRLWQVRINAALKDKNITYNKFINLLSKNNINLNRKVLAELAKDYPKVFDRILNSIV